MKILYITPAKLPSYAANSVHVMKMAQAFGVIGHNVFLAFQASSTYNKKSIFSLYGVKETFSLLPFQLNIRFFSRILFVFYVTILSVLRKFDLIYSRCVPTAFLAGLLGRKILLELHDTPKSFGPVSQWMTFKIFGMKGFIGLVVISNALKEHIVSISKINPKNIIVFHDGADDIPQDLLPTSLCPQSLEYSYHVGYAGHLYQGRGIDVIIEVAKLSPDSFFHIVGGNKEDVEYWKKSSRSIENINFYGHVPHGDVVRYILAFDVLLAPYQTVVAVHGNKGNTAKWMSPLKIFEYMSVQKPIVCSDIPVLREVLTDGLNAVLCAPDDISAWVQAVETIKNDKAFAEKIASNAKRDFLNHYTWISRARSILDCLSKDLQ